MVEIAQLLAVQQREAKLFGQQVGMELTIPYYINFSSSLWAHTETSEIELVSSQGNLNRNTERGTSFKLRINCAMKCFGVPVKFVLYCLRRCFVQKERTTVYTAVTLRALTSECTSFKIGSKWASLAKLLVSLATCPPK